MATKYHDFGLLMQARRRELGLSVYALAKMVGVTDQALANIEAGADPKLSTAMAVATALNCPLPDLTKKLPQKSRKSS